MHIVPSTKESFQSYFCRVRCSRFLGKGLNPTFNGLRFNCQVAISCLVFAELRIHQTTFRFAAMAGSFAVETPLPLQEIMLEFRAGIMSLEGTRVVPDTRKGLVRVARGDEGLLHFQWLNRTNNVVEIDQIVLPDEAIFEKVQQTSGRVYILKFKEDDRKFFFWMQEPKADGDSQICSSVNYFINRPIEEGDEVETSTALQMSEASDGAVGIEVSSRDANAGEPVLSNEALSGNLNPSAGPVQLADLQRILSSLEGNISAAEDTGPSLGDILKPELVLPLLEQFSLEERLAPYLPEGTWTREAFLELLQSPQFHQQVEAFSYVLRTGQIDLSQFGIDPSKYNFTVASFLEALDDAVVKNPETGGAIDSLAAPAQESRQEDNKDIDCNSQKKSAGTDSMDEGH